LDAVLPRPAEYVIYSALSAIPVMDVGSGPLFEWSGRVFSSSFLLFLFSSLPSVDLSVLNPCQPLLIFFSKLLASSPTLLGDAF